MISVFQPEKRTDRFNSLFNIWNGISSVSFPANPVLGADLQFLKSIQHIGFGHDDLGDPVDHAGNLSATRRSIRSGAAPGRGAKFVAGLPQFFSRRIFQFGGEGSAANPRAICFADADHVPDLLRCYAKTGTNTRRDGIGRGHKGKGAEIDIQHAALAPSARTVLPCASLSLMKYSPLTILN